jgi:hypothetical protein
MRIQLRVEKVVQQGDGSFIYYVVENLDRRWFKTIKRDMLFVTDLKTVESRIKGVLRTFAPLEYQGDEIKKLLGKTFTINLLEKENGLR